MNVLFITRSQVSPTKGGTERITYSVSKALTTYYSVNCFSGYLIGSGKPINDVFRDEVKLSRIGHKRAFVEFLVSNRIDWIVCQNEFEIAISIKKQIPSNIKVAFVHHYRPGWEKKELCKGIDMNRLFSGNSDERKSEIFRLAIYPYLIIKGNLFPWLYKRVYESVDKVILLSARFIEVFSKVAGKRISEERVSIIPNMLSFDYFATRHELEEKSKTVLIVSRLEENQKRISHAIRIWKELMRDESLHNWNLEILGDGFDKSQYERIVERDKIINIRFLGNTDPRSYYLKSSIFMMTSKSEGWGLTLTESQQMGCIPIAFDNFESLHDIIENGYNGIIIRSGDFAGYVDQMKKLMTDRELRLRMMSNAVVSSGRFEQKEIAKMWYDFLSGQTYH